MFQLKYHIMLFAMSEKFSSMLQIEMNDWYVLSVCEVSTPELLCEWLVHVCFYTGDPVKCKNNQKYTQENWYNYLGLSVWLCLNGFHSFLLTQYSQASPEK